MKCPYCDTEFEMETLAGYDADLQNDTADDIQWESRGGSEWGSGEADGLRSYVCKSCGGEIVGDETTAASACPFCGNPVIMTGQFSGSLKPDIIIPFKLDKNAAKEALLRHYSGKRLLPAIFKDQNHIDEIKGVYVPFWLYDARVDAHVRYRATKVRAWSDDSYNYTETQFFSVNRGGTLEFEGVPVDGSSKMADELMESIEPYDLADAVDFNTAYLSGYLADKYDVDSDTSIERANARVKSSTEDAFAATVQGYNTVKAESSNLSVGGGRSRYALCPVWLLNTTWNGQKYTFAMNGQTGKLVGDLPLDKSAANKWTIGLTAAIGAATYGLAWLLHFIGMI